MRGKAQRAPGGPGNQDNEQQSIEVKRKHGQGIPVRDARSRHSHPGSSAPPRPAARRGGRRAGRRGGLPGGADAGRAAVAGEPRRRPGRPQTDGRQPVKRAGGRRQAVARRASSHRAQSRRVPRRPRRGGCHSPPPAEEERAGRRAAPEWHGAPAAAPTHRHASL